LHSRVRTGRHRYQCSSVYQDDGYRWKPADIFCSPVWWRLVLGCQVWPVRRDWVYWMHELRFWLNLQRCVASLLLAMCLRAVSRSVIPYVRMLPRDDARFLYIFHGSGVAHLETRSFTCIHAKSPTVCSFSGGLCKHCGISLPKGLDNGRNAVALHYAWIRDSLPTVLPPASNFSSCYPTSDN